MFIDLLQYRVARKATKPLVTSNHWNLSLCGFFIFFFFLQASKEGSKTQKNDVVI